MGKQSILLVGENVWLLRAIHLLVESEAEFSVVGTCSVRNVIMIAGQTFPDIALFLPEISFVGSKETFSGLHRLLPHTLLIVITPDDTEPYETLISETNVDGFIFQNQLNTDLLPKMRHLSKKVLGTEYER